MEQPFDDDLNVLPYVPDEGEPGDYKFPSAVGYETVPEGWKPQAGRELPALRCTGTRPDGTRCKKFGLRGTGFNGTPSMCFTHGGSLPSVKKKAEATLLTAKMRLVENTDMALDTLFDLTKAGTADQVRLKAVTEILDRAGVKGGADVTVDVNHNIPASEKVQDQLNKIHKRLNPPKDEDEIIAEEITDEEIKEAESKDD